ncbi:uncharacterized protein LOC119588749 [Penaeus monodon]|uniref:uncharacterized protein LOC119588749 n=1 Tax=Penaeus monodon TaxID=6687 RepID=UPI0018A6EE1E|nr:uncharacterized protein LOC119588749 [Penaeus monodon]
MTLLWLQGTLLLLGICSASVLGPLETLWDEQEEKSVGQEAPYPPYLMQFGRTLTSVTHALLERHENMMNERLKRLEMLVDSACRPPAALAQAAGADFEARLTKRLDGFSDQISSLLQSLGDFGANIHFFMKKTEDNILALPTKTDIDHVQARLMAAARELTSSARAGAKAPTAPAKNLDKKLTSFVTRDDLAKHTRRLDYQLQGLRDQLGNASLREVLNLTRRTFRSLSSLRPLYESLAKVASNCDLKEGQFDRLEEMMQELSEDVDENGSVLSGMSLALEDAEDMLADRLTALERLTERLSGDSEPREATSRASTTSAPTTPESMAECLDSQFMGGRNSMDVCSLAVRYNKCRLQVVAYHCCRSCTDAGHTPEVGPHRFLDYPRRVDMFMGLSEGL